MKYFKRQYYLQKVAPYIDKQLIKVITGQRRIGKSYFLFQLIDKIKEEKPDADIIYINKEDLKYDNIRNYQDLVEYVEKTRSNKEFSYLFIDEIQDISQFEKALRHLQTKHNFDIYCTGSNAELLSGELSTYLSGRYIEIKIYGLSYSEFLQFHKLKDTAKSLNKYVKFGGLPYLHNLKLEENIVFDYLKNVYQAILFKDIVLRYNIRNVAFLERLIFFIADNIGQIFSAKNITNFLKSQNIKFNNSTVMDYLGHLSNAYFIFKVKRNDLKGKKILEINEKFFFGDLGLRHALTGYRTTDVGQLLENIVFLHLMINGYNVTVGKLNDKEIDFVCQKNNKTIYLQVTLSLTNEDVRLREYGNLLKIKDNHKKIVITADEYFIDEISGIETWNIRNFLLNFK